MSSTDCGASHPIDPTITCNRRGGHRDHSRGREFWPNTDFVEPPPPRRGGRGQPARDIAAFLDRTGGTNSLEEGMEMSFGSIRQDDHNWPIVQEVVRTVCSAHGEISSNEVWDVLIDCPDFTYGGDKGFMGSVLYQWAQKEGLVGKPVRKVPNRQPWGHSNEEVNVYPVIRRD